jgi:hypothetical protein
LRHRTPLAGLPAEAWITNSTSDVLDLQDMELMASGQLEKAQSNDFFKLLREALRYKGGAGLQACINLLRALGFSP